jgi:putative ABC transport system permease protein
MTRSDARPGCEDPARPWHLKGQVLAIAMVIASGVAVLVMSLSTQQALIQTVDAYYERYAFGDVFAWLTRAPAHVAKRIAAIEGVQTVEPRVVRFATLDGRAFRTRLGSSCPSLKISRPCSTGCVARWPQRAPNRPDEWCSTNPLPKRIDSSRVIPGSHSQRPSQNPPGGGHRVVLSSFTASARVTSADDLRWRHVNGPGSAGAAFDLQGSFNSVTLRLAKGMILSGDSQLTCCWNDRRHRAVAHADQLSNWFVMNEIRQLGTMSRILPAIFLLVSAVLTNMVLARLIATERSQIGLMKAFGYSNLEVAWHYAKLVLAIGLLGVLLGLAVGMWAGRMNTQMYAEVFRFPLLLYRPSAAAFTIAAVLSLLAALLGAIGSVRRAALLPPAQAMIPPSPPAYRSSRLAGTRLGRWLDQPTRIILRNIARGLPAGSDDGRWCASSAALLVLALQWTDALDYLAQRYFESQRQHVMVALAETQATTVVHEFEHMRGVLAVEPDLDRQRRPPGGRGGPPGSLTGIPSDARLQPIFDERRDAVIPVPRGWPGTGHAAGGEILRRGRQGLDQGGGGLRPEAQLPVVELFETHLGLPAFIHMDALNRLLGERPSAEYVNLLVDPAHEAELYETLKNLPMVSAMLRRTAIQSFYDAVRKT